jgi:segregation and condensation protein B
MSAADLQSEPARPLKDVLEAILFASHKPVSVKEFLSILGGASDPADPSAALHARTKENAIREALGELAMDCQNTGRAYHLRETAAGWQLASRPEFAPWLRQLFPENRQARLSAPALETLAIIAYRQPITRADIEAVRGVSVDGVMQTLLDRGLIRIAGRSEAPGRPLLYETTQFFMEHFGIKNLDELPNSAELRKIVLPKAESAANPAEPELPLSPAEAPPSPEAPSGNDATPS